MPRGAKSALRFVRTRNTCAGSARVVVWAPEAVLVQRLSRVPLAAAPSEALPVMRLAVPTRKTES